MNKHDRSVVYKNAATIYENAFCEIGKLPAVLDTLEDMDKALRLYRCAVGALNIIVECIGGE